MNTCTRMFCIILSFLFFPYEVLQNTMHFSHIVLAIILTISEKIYSKRRFVLISSVGAFSNLLAHWLNIFNKYIKFSSPMGSTSILGILRVQCSYNLCVVRIPHPSLICEKLLYIITFAPQLTCALPGAILDFYSCWD